MGTVYPWLVLIVIGRWIILAQVGFVRSQSRLKRIVSLYCGFFSDFTISRLLNGSLGGLIEKAMWVEAAASGFVKDIAQGTNGFVNCRSVFLFRFKGLDLFGQLAGEV